MFFPKRKKGSWALHQPPDPNLNLVERLYCGCLIVPHIKYRVELGDLQQVMDLLGEVEQLEVAFLLAHSGEGADQFADA